ncbi:MAG TPA: hypothetical protein VGF63_12710 [Solirubrobacteraceae bacterium]|jgi:hypothetical protein
MAHPAPQAPSGEVGQATVELVALLPLLAVFVALLWQAVVAGQAVWFAGTAARAAARASAIGADAGAAARRVLPDGLERGLEVKRVDGDDGVRVAISIPTVIGSLHLGTVSARARLQDQTR